jgi:hypothetical protein
VTGRAIGAGAGVEAESVVAPDCETFVESLPAAVLLQATTSAANAIVAQN